MKLKETEKARAVIDKILADREIELKEIENLISIDDGKIEECETTMEQAVKECNVEMYNEIRKEKKDHEILKEMHTKRLNQLTVTPLIKKADYEKLVSKIKEEFAEIYAKAEEKIYKTYIDLLAYSYELLEAQGKACNVLSTLQRDIYFDKDRSIHPGTGKMMVNESETQKVDINDLIYWAKIPSENAMFQEVEKRHPDLKVEAWEKEKEKERKKNEIISSRQAVQKEKKGMFG